MPTCHPKEDELNVRERFREALLFGQPDKVPLSPGGPRESTLAAWHQQGLPEGVHYYEYLMQVLGIEYVPTTPKVYLESQFGCSSFFQMIPTFEEKVVEQRENSHIVQDWAGIITEISNQYDYTYLRVAKDFVTRKYIQFPGETRQDWEEKLKWRYDAHHPDRIPPNYEAHSQQLRDRDFPMQLVISGPFWQLREWCGLENLCVLFIEQPAFVEEMIDFYSTFVIDTFEQLARHVTLDFVMISEDMAYKLHSMISPAMTRQFILPTWKKWVQMIKDSGCPVVCIDSDGYVDELMPLWIEAGFNCLFPVEVAAGNDIVALRREYGRQMAYLGGIDKRALAAGGATMRAEVMRVVPPLLEAGGFIPGCDHGVPPDISWPNYVAYARLLAELTGWL